MELSSLRKIAIDLNKPTRLNKHVEFNKVTSALRTSKGNIYTGVNLDAACSIGSCAEHGAVLEMLKNGEWEIEAIVAVNRYGDAIPPCGRCRELISQLSWKNEETLVEVENNKYMRLKELLPMDWKEATRKSYRRRKEDGNI